MDISFSQKISKTRNLVLFFTEEKKIYSEHKLSKQLTGFINNLFQKNIIDINSDNIFSTYFGLENIENIFIVKLNDNATTDDLRLLSAKISRLIQDRKEKNLSILLPEFKKISTESMIKSMVEGIVLATYQYKEYLSAKKDLKIYIDSLEFIANKSAYNQDAKVAMEIGNAVNFTRDLVNTPPSKLNPKNLEKVSRDVAKKNGLKITVLQEKDLLKQGMECLANVGFGSIEKSRLIILEYKPKKFKNKKPIVLVGKGITYDSGGINIKPAKGGFLEFMKDDMAGSATVLSLIRLASVLKLNLHIIAMMAVSENMLGCNAYKPGDILKAYNGKTVEILNTDAEGRLALADALSYSCKNHKPELIIDIATLTGAAMIALGYDYTPILGNDENLIKKLKESAKNTSEKIWELPLDKCYKKYMKGTISDLINSHEGINAGVITAATFLEEFVDAKVPWVHIDIAGSMMSMRRRADEPGGATGTMTRLLFDFLANY